MKILKSVLVTTLFTLLFSAGAFAQNAVKIIAVVNQANWCSICKAHGERALAALKENNKDGAYQFVINDISNAETAKKSAMEIEKLGLTKAMAPYKAKGMVCLFDPKTKQPVNQLLMALSSEDIARAMEMLKKGR